MLQHKGLIGIEVEVEKRTGVLEYRARDYPYPIEGTHWSSVRDGSLRNGIEFVLSMPLSGEQLLEAIDQLPKIVREVDLESPRTSTHIHCNVRDMSDKERANFLLALLFFEQDLLGCNKRVDRTKSNFCLHTKNSSYVKTWQMAGIQTLEELYRGRNLRTLAAEWPKYSAINIKPVLTIGSFEVRTGECMVKKGELLRHVNRILLLKKFSQQHTGEGSILEVLRISNPREIFKSSFRKSFIFSPAYENYNRVMDIIEGY